MKRFLRKLSVVLGYTFAGILILLAVIVGLFRLMLPRLPEYQEEIKGWASDAIGVEVEIFTAGSYDGVIQAIAADQAAHGGEHA